MNEQAISIEPRLPVTDLKTSLDFYRRLFNIEDEGSVMESDGFAIIRNKKIGIQLVTHSSDHPLSQNTIWINFPGVSNLYDKIKDNFIVEWGPEVYAYGRLEFAVLDPDRNRIIFSEVTPIEINCK